MPRFSRCRPTNPCFVPARAQLARKRAHWQRSVPNGPRRSRACARLIRRSLGFVSPRAPLSPDVRRRSARGGESPTERCDRTTTWITRPERIGPGVLFASRRLQSADARADAAAQQTETARRASRFRRRRFHRRFRFSASRVIIDITGERLITVGTIVPKVLFPNASASSPFGNVATTCASSTRRRRDTRPQSRTRSHKDVNKEDENFTQKVMHHTLAVARCGGSIPNQ